MFGVGGGEGFGLRSGGPIAIIFSLVCIGIAAFSFLIDFDAADQMIRAGAPEKAAWGIALGLTVTLVWLYIEILRLLSYLQQRLAPQSNHPEKPGTHNVPGFPLSSGSSCSQIALHSQCGAVWTLSATSSAAWCTSESLATVATRGSNPSSAVRL